MMMKVFFLLLALTSTLSQVFIPTQYVSSPQSYQALDNIWYRASICSTQSYVGCMVNVTVNLPHDAWDYLDGRFLQFSVFADRDMCAKVLCSNNASLSGIVQTSCSFRFTPDLANLKNLYITTKSGASPDIQATVNLVFQCSTRDKFLHEYYSEKPVSLEKRSIEQTGCPLASTILKEVIQLTETGQVMTSPDYPQASKFKFFVCGDGSHRYRATALTIATTIDSAFSSYVCLSAPCVPSLAPYQDPSGTGINTIVFQTPTPNPVEFFVSIYGWGKYGQWNYYRFGVNIESF